MSENYNIMFNNLINKLGITDQSHITDIKRDCIDSGLPMEVICKNPSLML